VNQRTFDFSRTVRNSLCTVTLIVPLFGLGCNNAADQKLLELRTRFVLAEEPASPVSIETAIAGIAENPEVTLLGRINAGTSEPFATGQATPKHPIPRITTILAIVHSANVGSRTRKVASCGSWMKRVKSLNKTLRNCSAPPRIRT
jgi:hypothetical protein